MNGAHADDALIETVRPHLALVPGDEGRVDGHEADAAAHAQRREQIGLAETDHRNVECAADFQKARLLKMADDKGVVTVALRLDGDADHLCGAAEFRQRMEKMIGRIEAVDFELHAGACGRIECRLQPLDIGRLFDRMNEALIPDARGTGRFGRGAMP